MATTSTNSLELEEQQQFTFYSVSPLYIRRISTNEIIKITNVRVPTAGERTREGREQHGRKQRANPSVLCLPQRSSSLSFLSASPSFSIFRADNLMKINDQFLNSVFRNIVRLRNGRLANLSIRFCIQLELFMATKVFGRFVRRTFRRSE